MLDQLYSEMKVTRLSIPVILLLVFSAGCSSSREAFQESELTNDQIQNDAQPKEKKLPLSEYESTLNPADFDKDINVAEKIHTDEKAQQSALEIPRDSIVVKEEPTQGFRIQVFSSSNVDEVNLMKSVVLEKFTGDSIYVVYDPPVYKIRVGDFLTRYEANQRLPEFVDKGYRDAWIVPDRVIQRKLVRINIPK
jgi:hypothetical protein